MGLIARAAVLSRGPLTDSGAHAQKQLPEQCGQRENHRPGDYAAFHLASILRSSFQLPPMKSFPAIRANWALE